MSAIELPRCLKVSRPCIERAVRQETVLSVHTAMYLAKFYGTPPEYWINVQRSCDLAKASEVLGLSEIAPLTAWKSYGFTSS